MKQCLIQIIYWIIIIEISPTPSSLKSTIMSMVTGVFFLSMHEDQQPEGPRGRLWRSGTQRRTNLLLEARVTGITIIQMALGSTDYQHPSLQIFIHIL